MRPAVDGLVLSSPMYHDPDPLPWPEPRHTATCNEGHAAPAPRCRCGIYGSIPGTLDSLPGYLADTTQDLAPFVYAEIGCFGRVFVDMRGVRTEHAKIIRIALADEGWPDPTSLGEATRLLSERYGVSVGGLDDVPDWVIGNRRARGKPPDEATLDLDALDLG